MRFVRSPFLSLGWDEKGLLTLTEWNSFRRFRCNPLIIAILDQLSEPRTEDEMVKSLIRYPSALIRSLFSALQKEGLIVCDETGGVHQRLGLWTLPELAVQRQATRGRRREITALPAPPAFKDMRGGVGVKLPTFDDENGHSLATVLAQRESVRRYSDVPMTLDELAEFLDRSARVRRVLGTVENQTSRRPYPSAGARHTLELFLLCERVAELDRGVYYYHPLEHRLYLIKHPDERYDETLLVLRANTDNELNRDPNVAIIITSVVERMMWSYQDFSLISIYRDVGALMQTMYLVATDLELAPCAVGSIQGPEWAAWLGLDSLRESHVGSFLLGKR